MKKEINITSYHSYLATTLNHPNKQLRWSEVKQAVVEVNWGQRLVRALHPSKRLAEDIMLIEKVIEMRDHAKEGSPFKLLGKATFEFTSDALESLDHKIRCVQQEVVLTQRSLRSKKFGDDQVFLYAFGKTGDYEQFPSWKDAAKIFYKGQIHPKYQEQQFPPIWSC